MAIVGVRPNHLEAHAEIFVDGRDMSLEWDPRLISLTIVDPYTGQSEANIDLDDSESGSWPAGQKADWLKLPRLGSRVYVTLGWPDEDAYKVFIGWVHDIECAGQRRSGRLLTVLARSGNAAGKQPQGRMWGTDAEKTSGGGGFVQGGGITLATVMQEAAKDAGYTTMNIDPKLAKIIERYWSQDGESFHNFGDRIARNYGGIFKVVGDTAGIALANGNTDALGQPTQTFQATVGRNVLSWRIKPFVTRPAYEKTAANWYDRTKGVMQNASHDVGTSDDAWGGLKTVFTSLFTQASDTQAQNQAEAHGANSNRSQASGWVVLDGTPRIKSKDKLVLSGFRPGVDGAYTVIQVEHQYSRKTGFITRCDINEKAPIQGRPEPLWQLPAPAAPQAANPPGGL